MAKVVKYQYIGRPTIVICSVGVPASVISVSSVLPVEFTSYYGEEPKAVEEGIWQPVESVDG